MENEVLVTLSRWPNIRLWKNETGAVPIYELDGFGHPTPKILRYVHYGLVGSADLSGILTLKNGLGVRLEIEIKTGAGKQTTDQKNFGIMIIEMGGLYLVGRGLQEIIFDIRKFECSKT